MNNAFPTRPAGTRPLRRNKAPGEMEFPMLFQLIPGPALLVDTILGQVQLANSTFLQLTAFSLNELIGRDLHSLISELPAHPLVADEMLSVVLDRRSRQPVTVNMQVRALDPGGQWLALLFEIPAAPQQKLLSRMDEVANSMIEMNRLSGDSSLRQKLGDRLKMVCDMLDVSAASVYSVDEASGAIWKSAEAGEPGLLPDTLPATDLLRLSQTFVWKPGRRVQTELHRSARMQNFTYLVSTPITHNGLLVLADRSKEPAPQTNVVIEALGRQFSIILDNLSLVADLRHQAQEKVSELSIWRSVGENAQEGILLVSKDLAVMEMNPAAEWMLGYADWEVEGQPVENILIGPERLMPALETACQGIPTHNMGNVSLHRRSGQSFPAHIQIVPVYREGITLAILVFFSDVSEHVEIRNRTQQLEQRAVLGEVTAVFAHEVRNPINNISTGLQLLSVKLPENDPNQDNIARLLNDCQRLNHLMESVLNFSRHVEHKFESVDIEILLRRLLDRWRPRMAKLNVEAFFQIEPGTRHVLGDPRSLEQVFTNLISNAVEAMGANASGGTLALRAEPFNLIAGRPQVEVSVSDNGPGIPDEIRERIFEPFVTTKAQGTGLGLAITKRIVTAHHGSISVNSFPGGTVFHVFLSAYEGEKE